MSQQSAAPAPPRLKRTSVWIRRSELILLGLVFALPPLLAWLDFLAFGLPPTAGNADPANPHGPHQFPIWMRGWHYLNLLLVVLLARTGWAIWRDQPRLAWTEDETGATEWASIAPWSESSGAAGAGRPRLDRVRSWHFGLAVAWAVSGWIYVGLVASTQALPHLIPTSWRVVPEAFHVFVQYATFHLPLDPDGYYRYNSLQLLSYAVVMFGFVPLICLTGLAITPAVGGRFRPLARLFGNRAAARSIHYLAILAYSAFIAVHICFVVMYACWLDLDHIVLGTDETGLPGGVIGAVGIGGIVLVLFMIVRQIRRRSG